MKRNCKYAQRDRNVAYRGWATAKNGQKIEKKTARRVSRHEAVIVETISVISDEQKYLEKRLECLLKAQSLLREARRYQHLAEKAKAKAVVEIDIEGVIPVKRHDKEGTFWNS